jgi:protoporphyrinogen IX oxidase
VTATSITAEARSRWTRPLAAVAIVAAAVLVLVIWHPSYLYPWFKAFHIIAVIAWMAGMLYLPRLFVYHCEAEIGSRQSETFKVMERRLLRGIINPAMVASWMLGLWIAYDGHWLSAPWLWSKLVLVAILSGIHGLLVRWTRDFAVDRNGHSQRFYRIVNEIPAVLLTGIVIFAVIKPF